MFYQTIPDGINGLKKFGKILVSFSFRKNTAKCHFYLYTEIHFQIRNAKGT